MFDNVPRKRDQAAAGAASRTGWWWRRAAEIDLARPRFHPLIMACRSGAFSPGLYVLAGFWRACAPTVANRLP